MRFYTKGSIHVWLLVFILLAVGIGIIIGPRFIREYRFARYGQPKSADNPFVSGSEELKSCMKEAIGEQAFTDIAQDKRPPTDKEREKLQPCWPKHEGKDLQEKPFAKESEETKGCLRQAVGETAFEEISQGKRAPTQEEEQNLRTCFELEAP